MINGSLVFISFFCDCSILSVKHFSVFLCFGVWIILQLEMLLLAAHLHLFVAPVELKDKKLHATGSTFQFGITLLNIWTVCVTAVTSWKQLEKLKSYAFLPLSPYFITILKPFDFCKFLILSSWKSEIITYLKYIFQLMCFPCFC